MDRITKALQKLSPKERRQFRYILTQLFSGSFEHFDIKKLKGREDIFRARKGRLRVLFRKKGDDIYILAIERWAEKTYRF